MMELLKILPVLAIGTAICIFLSAWILMRLGMFAGQEMEEGAQPELRAAPSALDVKLIFPEEQAKDNIVITQPTKMEVIEYKFSTDHNAYQRFVGFGLQPIELTHLGEHYQIVTYQQGKMARFPRANFRIPEKTYFHNLKDSRALLAA